MASSLSAPWHFNSATPTQIPNEKGYQLVPAHKEDISRVNTWYQFCPVPGYDIKSVEVIHNAQMGRVFEGRVELLQKREGNPVFTPKYSKEPQTSEQLTQREQVIQLLKILAKPHTYKNAPNVSLLPLWHGTKQEILESIFTTGYANLATTDSGFFGKGLYNAGEAEYSYRVYAKGALIINWVAVYSAFPTIHGDMDKLEGKGNYQNYDGHFVPVYPKNPNNPNESVYYPCTPQQKHRYTELVVFDPSQVLPRYLVTLQPSLPNNPQLLKTALDVNQLLSALLEFQMTLNEDDEAYTLIDQKLELYGKNNRPLSEKEVAVYNLAQRITGIEDKNQKTIFGKKISLLLKQMNETSNIIEIKTPTYKPVEKIIFTQPTTISLPSIAFGKAKWARYFGAVGVEPLLPPNIDQILKSTCPIFGKPFGEAYLLVLIPATVNGQPFTLNLLSDLIQKPKEGSSTQYSYYWDEIKKQYGDTAPGASYWALYSRDVIPSSRNKKYDAQKQLVESHSKKSNIVYEVPRLLEAATSVLMEYVQTGTRLYTNKPWTFTRCQERVTSNPSWPLVLGGFSSSGLSVFYNCAEPEDYGIGVLRKF